MHALVLAILWLTPSSPPTSQEIPPATRKLLAQFRKEFVVIQPGRDKFPKTFRMGGEHASSSPIREVAISGDFAICKYETTQELYEAVMGANPSRWKGPRNSVEMTSFADAEEFCRRATRQMIELKLIDSDQWIRLPSEAEWEYAARAGAATRYSFGDRVEDLDQYAWHTGNAAGNDPPVGAKKPNAWGLYDMHGYLWEWCADAGHANYQEAPADSRVWTANGVPNQRVIRGGSWKDTAASLESACRHGEFRSAQGTVRFAGGVDQSLRDDAVGFRCVLSRVAP